jgi:hypothetical protein
MIVVVGLAIRISENLSTQFREVKQVIPRVSESDVQFSLKHLNTTLENIT